MGTIAVDGSRRRERSRSRRVPKRSARVPCQHSMVTASPYTSCAFANQIDISFWQGINSGNCSRYAYKCGGSVWSPATEPLVSRSACLPSARPVTCYTNGHDSWIKFYPGYD